MKKINALFICFFIIIIALTVFSGCKFNDVKDVDLSFYDGTTLLFETTLFKYENQEYIPPEKDGFVFGGWYLDMDCTKKADFGKIKDNTVLYAYYKRQTRVEAFVVTFCDIDNQPISSQTVYSLNDLVYPDPPTVEGYAFVGWSDLPDDLDSNVFIYARYAKEYTVLFFADSSDTVPIKKQIVLEGQSAVPPPDPEKAGNDQYYYTFSKWDKKFDRITSDLTVTAVFVRHTRKYTYTFVDDDGKILISTSAYYGSIINAPKATKPTDDTYAYIFEGWDLDGDGKKDSLPETLTRDFTAKALYTKTLKTLTVNFYVDDILIQSVSTVYGSTAEYTGETPVKQSTKAYDYRFAGWDAPLDNITQDTDVHALFDEYIRYYTYTFIVYDNDKAVVVAKETVEYGTVIVAPEPIQKERDAEFEYTFGGWSGYVDQMIIEQDQTFVATYNRAKRKYTYTFYYGKNIVSKVEAEYGSVIVAPPPPESSDGSVFVRWIGFSEGMILKEDVKFYALYE